MVAPGALGVGDASTIQTCDAGDEQQRHADHRGAEHADLTQQHEVAERRRRQRPGNEDVAGREDGRSGPAPSAPARTR